MEGLDYEFEVGLEYRCRIELDYEYEVRLDLEWAAELESGYEFECGCAPKVDLGHRCGLDPDLVHAQPQLMQLVG